MSEVFAWHPDGSEQLADFNVRLGAYCTETPVVVAQASVIGPALALSLTEMEDAPPIFTQALQPVVMQLTEEGLLNFERTLTGFHTQIQKWLGEDATVIQTQVFRAEKISGKALPFVGYAVLIVHISDIDVEPEAPEGGGQ